MMPLWLLLLLLLLCACSVGAEEIDDVPAQNNEQLAFRPLEVDAAEYSIGDANNYQLVRLLDDDFPEILPSRICGFSLPPVTQARLSGSKNNKDEESQLVFMRTENSIYDSIVEDLRTRCSVSTSIYNVSEEAFAGGRFGHVWLGRSFNLNDTDFYVLKRIAAERGIDKLLTARRELYFGLRLHSPGILRYEECFVEQLGININIRTFRPEQILYIPWLIYKYEGVSLYHYLYTNNHGIIEPSAFWSTIQSDESVYKQVFYQLFKILSVLHQQKIIHRDIKPENLCIMQENDFYRITLIDWGSALDSNSSTLYPLHPPSLEEVTTLYAPPEALQTEQYPIFNDKYDIWSTGIMMIEMMLGHKDIFQCPSRLMIRLKRRHPTLTEEAIQNLCRDHLYNNLCMYITDIRESERCIQKNLQPYLLSINTNNNRYILRNKDRLFLLHSLLQYEPENRITPDEALQHPYFKSFPYKQQIDELYRSI